MSQIEWDNSLSIGHEVIDRQHRHLIHLINQFGNEVRQGCTQATLTDIISELGDYAQTHFQTEEELFFATRFPHRELHEQEHSHFVDRVFGFYRALDAGDPELADEIYAFLCDWLANHILKSDMKLRGYLPKEEPA